MTGKRVAAECAARPRDERAVTELAWGLSRMFHDNPGLLEHLDGLLKAAR